MTADLAAWLAWLRIPDCACPWTRDPTPALPQGWKRGHAHPDCRHHGSAAGAADIAGRTPDA